uniref:C2H2-type domain-containing protein n=1 Tax=Stegastes partitus TaxID=144197 RepID=A0A3B5AHR8_9TELE
MLTLDSYIYHSRCSIINHKFVEMLVREAARKISTVFSQLSSLLQAENGTRTRERGNRRVIYRRDRTTVNVTPFSCRTCHKGFDTASSLKRHELIHTGSVRHSCDTCGKSFFYKKPHKCEQCGKAFRIYTNYQRHLRIHTGEKPYECEVCGVRFRQLGHVKFHMQVHTGERPYSCSSCGLGFSDSRLLKRHNCSGKYQKVLANTLTTS